MVGCSSTLALGVLACGSDTALNPPSNVDVLYWDLRLNHSAVQLSVVPPYNTVQLEAIPITPDGQTWTYSEDSAEAPRITTVWTSADASKVDVSANGFVTARAATPAAGLLVRVSQQIGTVTHFDTVRVQVNTLTNPPIIKKFTIRPTDSLKRAFTFLPVIIPTVIQDTNGTKITGLPVSYLSSNTDVGKFGNKWTGNLLLQGSLVGGITRVTASTFAYGVAAIDTFTLEWGWAITLFTGNPEIAQVALPQGSTVYKLKSSKQDIGPGGVVFWENASGIQPSGYTGELHPAVAINVVFDDTTNVLEAVGANASGSGNIVGIPGDTLLSYMDRRRYRRFVKSGEYRYTIQPWGFRGVVVVHDR